MSGDLLTRREAAARCRISLDAFARLVQPRLPLIRIGRVIRIRASDVDKWLDEQAARSTALAYYTRY